jgi:hypothetical protein
MAGIEQEVRDRVKDVVEAEFTAEGFEVADDKLGRSAGKDGEAVLAVYPERTGEDTRNVAYLEVQVVLQLYLAYEPVPDENIVVNPGVIEGYADRLREAFRTQSTGTGSDFWFLRLRRIEFPDDPTGNKSRLEAYISGWGENAAGLPG